MAEEKKKSSVDQIKDLAVGAVTDPSGTAKKAAEQAKGTAELAKMVAEQATKAARTKATEVAAAALTTAASLMSKKPDRDEEP